MEGFNNILGLVAEAPQKNFFISLSDFLAIGAVIISIVSLYVTRKNNKKTLYKKFFEEIMFEYMLDKIPNSLRELENSKSMFKENCEKFENIVSKMLDDILFYKYFEAKFYNELKCELIKLDEILTEIPDSEICLEVYKKKVSIITDVSNDIYKILKKYYG